MAVAAVRHPRRWLLHLVAAVGWLLLVEVVLISTVRQHMHRPLGLIGGWIFVVFATALFASFTAWEFARRGTQTQMLMQHEETLAALVAITEPALASLAADELVNEMAARLHVGLALDATVILLLTVDGYDLEARCWRGAAELGLGELKLPVDSASIADLARHRRAVALSDTTEATGIPLALRRFPSLVICPVFDDRGVAGMCVAGSTRWNGFSQSDMRLVELVADRVAAALERGRLDQAERRARLGAEHSRLHVTLLARASEVLATAIDDFEPNLMALLDVVVPAFADASAVDLVQEGGSLRRLAIRHGAPRPPSDTEPLSAQSPVWKAMAAKAIGAGDAQFEWATPEAGPDSDRSSLIIAPIRVSGLTLGLISFATAARRRGYRPSDVSVTEEIAGRAAITMERVLLYRELDEAATATARTATHLRELVEVSLELQSTRDVGDVLRLVVGDALGVLGTDTAMVIAGADGCHSIAAVARTGQVVLSGSIDEVLSVTNLPSIDGGAPLEGWLIVPIPGAGGQPRGWVGITRHGESGADDRAMLLLLTQTTAAALDAVDLYEAIETREARWRMAVEAAPAGIVEVDLEGRILLWNRSAAILFGWPQQPTGETVPDFDETTAQSLSALWVRAATSVAIVEAEIRMVTADDQPRDLAVSIAPLVSAAGVVEGMLTLAIDISEQRRFHEGLQQAQRIEALGEVAGGVAHDFNNLLTIIGGYTELLLLRATAESRDRELLNAIRSATDRASLLTRQLLAISRREMAKPIAVDTNAALRALAAVLERILGVDINLEWDLDPIAGTIRIDPGRFDQAILNLAINARDAMPGGGRLRIAADRLVLDSSSATALALDAGPFVRITVTDSGSGMEDEIVARCFDPFFTTKERSGGTGLGLSAVRSIVADGGGTTTVESRVGVGTTFALYLASVDETARVSLPPEVGRRPWGSETILVVEDEPAVRTLVSQTLRRDGYTVLEAAGGSEAVAMAEQWKGPIDLLITDVVLPGMRGPKIAEEVKALVPNVTVLFMSGYTHGTVLPASLAGDPWSFLAKPFRPSELAERVRALLDRRAARSDSPHLAPS